MLLVQISPSLSLSICPYHSLLLAGLPKCILCLCRAVVGKFLLVDQHCHVHYVGVHRRILLLSSSLLLQQYPAYLVCLTWMLLEMEGKWPYSWCFREVASWICPVLFTAFLWSSCLAFSIYVLSVFIWCIHRVVLTQLLLGRNPILSYWIDQTSIWLIVYW